MNWEALSAIGEIAGALAVVVTLLYLAIQTKTASRAFKAGSAREMSIAESSLHMDIAKDKDLQRIMLKSMKSPMEEYSPEEWLEFRMLAMSVFLQFEARFVDHDLSIGRQDQIFARLDIAKGLIVSFPAWKRFWEEETNANGFAEAYISAVNTRVDEVDFQHMATGKSE